MNYAVRSGPQGLSPQLRALPRSPRHLWSST